MPRPPAARMPGRLAGLIVLVAGVVLMPAVATADPYRPALTRVAARPLGSVTASAGAAAATLEPRDFAVPVDSRYSFAAKVRVDGKADLVQMRFKVLNPSGKLMIQRTIIQSDVTTGQASAVFERELADLGLEAGAYPVQLEVRVAQGNQVSEAVLDSELLLFDRKGQRIPLVFAVRVSGQPLADPSGRFVADPARYTRRATTHRRLAQWVLDDDDARITLAISPLLLEEWRRISEGYVLTGPEGDVSVAATEAVPAAYDAALDTIKRAARHGTPRADTPRLRRSQPCRPLAADVDVRHPTPVRVRSLGAVRCHRSHAIDRYRRGGRVYTPGDDRCTGR